MERITLRLCASVLLVLGLVLSSFTNISAKEPEEIWQELGKLPGAERQKRLVAGAKAEGTAVLYSNISEDNIQKLRPDFEKRYPVKLDSYRASGERIANRVLTEARAGKFIPDVIGPSNEHVSALTVRFARESLLSRHSQRPAGLLEYVGPQRGGDRLQFPVGAAG